MGAKRKPLPKAKVSHVTELPKTVEQVNKSDKNKIFSVRTANARITEAKKIDIPKKLFGSFIYSEGLTVFYGNTHSGKTAVAMNIAEAITSGKQLSEIPMEAEPQPCVFFDFELSDKNFELKSSEEYQNHYIYSDNLITVTPNLEKMDASQITAKFIIDQIKSVVEQLQAKVFFIDNISWLEQNVLSGEMNQSDAARDLGVSRQQISRDVKKLSNGDFFHFDNQGIEIKKP